MIFTICFCLLGVTILAGYILWSTDICSYNKEPIKEPFLAGGSYIFNKRDGYHFLVTTKPLEARGVIDKIWLADARYVLHAGGDKIRVSYGRHCWGDFLVKDVYILPVESGESKRGFYYQRSGVSFLLGPIKINPKRPVLFLPSIACHDADEVVTIEGIVKRSIKELPELMLEER